MKRLFVLLAATLLAVVGIATSAQAANPHVVKGPDVSVSGNTLTITASIAGLGNVPTADFSLTGTVDVFFAVLQPRRQQAAGGQQAGDAAG